MRISCIRARNGKHWNSNSSVQSLRSGQLLLSVTKESEIDQNKMLKKFMRNNTNHSAKFKKLYTESYDEVTDHLMYARSLFDLREFKRCAHVLKPLLGTKNQSVIFMYYYTLYMYGDIRKQEEEYEKSKLISAPLEVV